MNKFYEQFTRLSKLQLQSHTSPHKPTISITSQNKGEITYPHTFVLMLNEDFYLETGIWSEVLDCISEHQLPLDEVVVFSITHIDLQ